MKAGSIATVVIAAALCTISFTVRAQDAPVPAVEISGFADVYYSKNVAHPVTGKNQLRNFDIAENQFTLSLVEIVLQKKSGPIGFRMDLDYGTTNDLVQPGVSSTLSMVQQAYLTAVIPLGSGLTVDAGKFATHMGQEVIESKDNWNYSRSFLFAWAIPYYHTGVRLSYPLAENLNATAHILNGWNSGAENNDYMTLGLTLNWAVTGSTGIILNAIDGFENLTGIETGKRTVVDLVVTHKFSDAFSVSLNADYGQAKTNMGLALWKGAAFYAKVAVGDKSALAVRGEIFDDPQGYATGLGVSGLNLKEFTATYEYAATSALLVRGEVRHDISSDPVFDEKAPSAEKNQTTLLLGAVVLF